MLELIVQVYVVVYGFVSIVGAALAVLACAFGKEDPRFEGDKLIYRS